MSTRQLPAALTTLRDRLRGSGAASSSGGPIWLVLCLVFLLSWALVGNDFVSFESLQNMGVRSVALGLVAIGQTIVILCGSLDLTVAYTVSVGAVLASFVMQGNTAMMIPAVLLVLAVGALVGLVNGLVITRLHLNAFIATLGVSLVIRGLLNAGFDNFAGEVPTPFRSLGYSTVAGIPVSVLMLAGVAVAVWWLLRRTRFGYHVYAVGGGEETARLSGVRSVRTVVIAHVLCSLCAVASGLFLVSRLGAGAPWVGPNGGYDLESIAAVVVGGTALLGGRGDVRGTIAGVLILAVLDNLFNVFQVDPFLKSLLRGVIIIGAVALYAMRDADGGWLARRRGRPAAPPAVASVAGRTEAP